MYLAGGAKILLLKVLSGDSTTGGGAAFMLVTAPVVAITGSSGLSRKPFSSFTAISFNIRFGGLDSRPDRVRPSEILSAISSSFDALGSGSSSASISVSASINPNSFTRSSRRASSFFKSMISFFSLTRFCIPFRGRPRYLDFPRPLPPRAVISRTRAATFRLSAGDFSRYSLGRMSEMWILWGGLLNPWSIKFESIFIENKVRTEIIF